jgi:DMSO/TMAO reductase YedYZ molybdopterin-dependent catalytic subunit
MDSTQSLYPPGPILVLDGAVDHPLSLDVAALRAYERVSLEPFDLFCFSTGQFIRSVGSYRGVPLRVLLDAAGVRQRGNMDFKRTVFLAHAHDGYAVTFSWHELFNSPIGDSVLVAYASGDVPLEIEDGLPILVSGADTVRAPRHVKRLARVDALVLGSATRP